MRGRLMKNLPAPGKGHNLGPLLSIPDTAESSNLAF